MGLQLHSAFKERWVGCRCGTACQAPQQCVGGCVQSAGAEALCMRACTHTCRCRSESAARRWRCWHAQHAGLQVRASDRASPRGGEGGGNSATAGRGRAGAGSRAGGDRRDHSHDAVTAGDPTVGVGSASSELRCAPRLARRIVRLVQEGAQLRYTHQPLARVHRRWGGGGGSGGARGTEEKQAQKKGRSASRHPARRVAGRRVSSRFADRTRYRGQASARPRLCVLLYLAHRGLGFNLRKSARTETRRQAGMDARRHTHTHTSTRMHARAGACARARRQRAGL
jgi:hypothetical protein